MQFAKFLSLAIVAFVPALAATDAALENTEASLYPLEFYHGSPTWSDGDGSCFSSSSGVIHSVKLAHGLTCNLYFERDCKGDPFALKGDSPSVLHEHGTAALSARCWK